MVKDRQQGDAQVQADTETHAPKHGREDCVMNSGQKHDKTRKEKEHRNMKQRGQRLDGPREMQLLDALGEERADPRALVRAVAQLRHAEVSAGPLLQRRGQQGACETDHEAAEPERVVPDGGSGWPERGRIGGCGGQRNGRLRAVVGCEDLGDGREIERGGVLRARLQSLVGPDEKSRDRGRKQTSL